MTFEAIMQVTAGVSSHAAFEEAECRLFHVALEQLPPQSNIVEVGVEFGRSSSIIAQVALERGHRVTFIDPFVDPASLAPFVQLMQRIGLSYTLHVARTAEVPMHHLPLPIHFLHVDGDHTRAGIETDFQKLLPRVAVGGYVCCHDYGRDSLPDVWAVCNEQLVLPEWMLAAHAGTLGVWRRQ